MELDQTLFGLDPFLTESLEGKLPVNDIFKESYTTLLNQLSVLLRTPSVRDEPVFKENFGNFVTVLGRLLNLVDAREIVLELLKVLINGVADNDDNRDTVLGNSEFWTAVPKFLNEEFDDDEVNERLFITLQNLIAEDVENHHSGKYIEKTAKVVAEPLYRYLQYNWENQVGIELFTDLISTPGAMSSDVDKIDSVSGKLVMVLDKYRAKDFITDDDGVDEVIVNYSKILEILTTDLGVRFNANYEVKLQTRLLSVFKTVEHMEIPNQLKFQRQIYASIGNISSNNTSSNKIELQLDECETNGYVISSICLILGNSISSSEDRAKVLDMYPNLITNLVSKFQYLTDPIQFQGFLQLLKNVVSLQNYDELFQDFDQFALIIESVLRNSKYYPNLVQLFSAFFKKLLVFVNKDQLNQLIKIEEITSFDEDKTIVLLILNKLVIYHTANTSLLQRLTSKAMKFTQDAQIEISTLFELTKTVGLLSNNQPDLLVSGHPNELLTLLTSISELQERNGAVDAVKNNARYIAGQLLDKTTGALHQVSRDLLQEA